MKKMNIVKLLMLLLILSLFTSCKKSSPSVASDNNMLPSPTITLEDNASLSSMTDTSEDNASSPSMIDASKESVFEENDTLQEKLLAEIITMDSTYKNYDVDVVYEDYDDDNSMDYFFILTKKGTKKEYYYDYLADIWFGNEYGVTKLVGTYIHPDTYGTIELAGRKYFRYDLSYVTESQTILIELGNNQPLEAFQAPGAAMFTPGSNDFAVTHGSYDLSYLKEDQLLLGHTYKPYYFYADESGFHEYTAILLTMEEYLQFTNGQEILDDLNRTFEKKDYSISYELIKRSNGLLHINLSLENESEINYQYRTYRIDKDNTLKLLDSGEGNYASYISERKAGE